MQRNQAALLKDDHAQKLQLETTSKESIQKELGTEKERNETIDANNKILQQDNAVLKVSDHAM